MDDPNVQTPDNGVTPLEPGTLPYQAALGQTAGPEASQVAGPAVPPSQAPNTMEQAESQGSTQAPQMPARPPGTSSLGQYQGSKSQIFRSILGDFLYSAGKGLAASGHGPEANARGAGEAIGALRERDIQNQQLAMQRQGFQTQQQQAQAGIAGTQARTAMEQQETARSQAITPFDIQEKKLAVAVMQAQMKFFSDPTSLQESVQDVTKSLGKLSPEEQSMLDSAQKDAQITRKFDPIVAAVKNISDNRITTNRQAETSPFKAWRTQFIAANAREPTAKEILDFNTAGARLRINATQGNVENTRLDKSYQYNTTQLSNIGKPITDRADRLNRLQISLDEKSPQADALIAPELLTAMAGGQGSGLRMNEAEISRIVGGRTALEDLKAKLNHYQLDPSKGLSVTDAQRQQIYSLIGKMNEKVQKKVSVLNDAQQQMINAPDVEAHRKILADTKTKLTEIDTAKGGDVVQDLIKDYKK